MRIRRLRYVAQQLVRIDRTTAGRIAGVLLVVAGIAKAIREPLPEKVADTPAWLQAASTRFPALDVTGSMRDALATTYVVLITLAALAASAHVVSMATTLRRPRSAPGRFTTRLIRGTDEAVTLQNEIVRVFFPRSPVPQHARVAQQKNNERLIGVFEDEQVVGYCSLWPVNEAAATAIIEGYRTDDDLTPDDLVDTASNRTVRHIVIVGMGVLPEVSSADPRAGAKLIRAVKEVLRDCYFRKSRRRITLIAIAYTEFGRRACEIMGLQPTGVTVTYPVDIPRYARLLARLGLASPLPRHPVCARDLSATELAWANEVLE